MKAAPTPLPSFTVLRTNSESKPRCPEQPEPGPAITFYLGKWGSSGQFCSDRPKTSDLDVSDHLLSEAIEP